MQITEFGVFSCQKSRNSEFFLVKNHEIRSFFLSKITEFGVFRGQKRLAGGLFPQSSPFTGEISKLFHELELFRIIRRKTGKSFHHLFHTNR